MNVTMPVYRRRVGGAVEMVAMGVGDRMRRARAKNAPRAKERLIDALRKWIADLETTELGALELARGTELRLVHLELGLRGHDGRRKVSGTFPIILEPRWRTDREQVRIAYHPLRPGEWFPASSKEPLPDRARRYFSHVWADVDDEELEGLKNHEKPALEMIAFDARTRSLLDQSKRRRSVWDDLDLDRVRGKKRRPGLEVLPTVGTNLTARAAGDRLPLGRPRAPWREQLQHLGEGDQSVIVVGPPGAGKTMLLRRLVDDLLESDGYRVHRNLDRVRHVWALSAQRLLSGMSYFGEWEQRVVRLLEEVRRRRILLYLEDVHAFGRAGRTRDSERCLADLFRGPLVRGEAILLGECTAEQLQQLEYDAPSFADAFNRLALAPATPKETLLLMLDAGRRIEQEQDVAIHPAAYRTVLESAQSLMTGALPGSALDLMRHVARRVKPTSDSISTGDVVERVSERTGLPRELLRLEAPLAIADVDRAFERRVHGQPAAIAAARDLVLRIRTGLVDPRRPYAVYLLTGPTGTGKTELAKAMAEYLYGDSSRLLRFDMGELSGPDATARLIGDAWNPEGTLTTGIRSQPFSVVLLDEIEKAHRSVLHLLLQVFEDGRLTDAAGHTADFTHSVVVMTSNLGAKPRPAIGFGEPTDGMLADVAKAVREFFPPELFNRIDRVVPFSPLTADVAERIAEKELTRATSRRGLTERNVFVFATESATKRMAAEAFDPRDGARSVKRYLERRIVTLLADELSRKTGGAMRICRVYATDDDYRVQDEVLDEAEPEAAELPLERAATTSVGALLERIPAALERVDALLDGDDLAQLTGDITRHLAASRQGDASSADLLFDLDMARAEVGALRERLAGISALSRDTSWLESTGIDARIVPKWVPNRQAMRLLERRTHASPSSRPTKNELLALLADVAFLGRMLQLARDPSQHTITLELSTLARAAHHSGPGLLEWLVTAYAGGRGKVVAVGVRTAEGDVLSGSPAELDDLIATSPSYVALRIVGVCVREYFTGEIGTQVWTSLASGSEVTRISWADGDAPVADLARQRVEAQRAFDRALERGADPLPRNPSSLLPTVRKYRFDPPRRSGDRATLEVEDFRLGWATSLLVRRLDEVLPLLWVLSASRVAPPNAEEKS